MTFRWCAALLLLSAAACGVKGNPRPPKRTFVPDVVERADAGCCEEKP